ncbi:MAG: EF-P lysine aminoacylase GenX [Deltaproteobacteria bacterium]|nr:EF-P lysine aminoacylase GenX [Deltaproteobacteria bacterium]
MPSFRDHNLRRRAIIIHSIREFFVSRGFLEVETPQRIPANALEEHIEPLRSDGLFLHTSPEVCMKRLLCRGHGRIFQICRCWRGNERGARHVPEFTMLEWYRADSDYLDLMRDCEELLRWVFAACQENGQLFSRQERETDLNRPWPRITVQEAFRRFALSDPLTCIENGLYEEILVSRIEPALAELGVPVILMDYPAEMAALARLKPDDPTVAERFELYAGGLELANGFSELTDPAEQRARFEEANRRRSQAGLAPLPLPAPFLDELAAMPPAAGIALGVDRLVMLLCGAKRIDDVVAFTPEEL